MFEKVIVGIDGGPTGRDAAALAELLAAPGSQLSLANIHTLTPVRGASGAYGPAETEESRELLDAERTALGINAELLTLTASSVGRGLHHLVHERNADLLAVGSNPRGLVGRVLMGDATRAALVGAPCAVAIAPRGYAGAGRSIATIGVGYDGSPESEAALTCARELATRHSATLKALTVVETPLYAGIARVVAGAPSEADEIADATEELAKLDGVQGTVVVGLAGEELASFTAGVDLLIVGARGYGPIRSLMFGTTSTHLASNARSPLLVLPRLG
ncbi:MAG TPA: universal stress protein [Solirubrobacteraceae bacterium]|jgi:nucleotide-binding universal stress UspA family protein